MDMLREHLEESEAAARQDSKLHTAIMTCWYAFDKWYEAIDHTPISAVQYFYIHIADLHISNVTGQKSGLLRPWLMQGCSG